MAGLIGSIIPGLVVGSLGAWLVPGRTPGGKPAVFGVGIFGALLGDLLFNYWLWILLSALLASMLIFFILDRRARQSEP